jgi:hypothetical protein
MVIRIVEGLAGAREATGVVVVIDVMRAFTGRLRLRGRYS